MAKIEIDSERKQGFQLRQVGDFVGRVVELVKRKIRGEKKRSSPWTGEEAELLLGDIGRRAPHRHSPFKS